MERMRIGSLFDGSGTAPLAATMLGWEPIWASEIEPFPVAVTRARFPNMKHLGDITEINGEEIEPVDVIVGGSPCQDLSVAGKQAGLENGTRSNMFYEMTRIIREMRGATNGKYPRFVVWENVPGAFSSNKGNDFHEVLKAFCAIADDTVSIARPAKWRTAGTVVGAGWSFAWRILDAQYWGVPQRRRRIFAVLDFGSERAGEILFERTGLPRDSEPSEEAGEGTTADAVGRADRGGGVTCLNPHDSQTMRVYDADGIYPALAANSGGGQNRQAVIYPVGAFCAGAAPAAGSIGYSESVAPTLKAAQYKSSHAVVYPVGAVGSLCARADSSPCIDRGQPFIAYESGQGYWMPGFGCLRADGENRPSRPSHCVIALQGNGIDRALTAGCNGAGWREGEMYTLNTVDRPAVAYGVDCRNGVLNKNVSGTLQAKPNGGQSLNFINPVVYDARGNGDGAITPTLTDDHQNRVTDYTAICIGNGQLNQISMSEKSNALDCMHDKQAVLVNGRPPRKYIVRRLTPLECARLQGFPDWWTDGVQGSDSAKYKMWGNGMALPCLLYVMKGIADALQGGSR